MNSYI